MPSFCFLKLGLQKGYQIIGDSLNMDFPGWIEIEAWSFDMEDLSTVGMKERKKREREFRFTFSKPAGGASSQLAHACQTGVHFDGGILAIEGPGAPSRIHLDDVLITGIQIGQSETDSKSRDVFTILSTSARRYGVTENLPVDGFIDIVLRAAAAATIGGPTPTVGSLFGQRRRAL